jgi:hypothetical protein
LLLAGDYEGALETHFRFRAACLGRPQCDFTSHAVDFCFTPSFLGCFHRRHGLANAYRSLSAQFPPERSTPSSVAMWPSETSEVQARCDCIISE